MMCGSGIMFSISPSVCVYICTRGADGGILWWLAVESHSFVFVKNRSYNMQRVIVNSWFCLLKKGRPYSITEYRVLELILVFGSQPAGDVSGKPSGRLPLLYARPAVTLATRKRAATSFAAWWTEARWVWMVCLRLLPDSVTAAIWTQALLYLSPAR